MKEYPEKHQQGIISIEKKFPIGVIKGDLGIQIAPDGRIWVCIDGIAFLRFRPFRKGEQKDE